MHIGKWIVRVQGWSLVFYQKPIRIWRTDITADDLPGFIDLHKYYSAEDVRRWQDELNGHMHGCGEQPLVGNPKIVEEKKSC